VPTFRGEADGSRIRVAVVVSSFNEGVTRRLLSGAVACLESRGCSEDRRTVVHVPGAWELPQAARRVAARGEVDAIVALGALIRGETAHFDVLADQVARGLAAVAEECGIPTTFGVLTTDTVEQAMLRSGDDPGNKGREAALAALEMADLYARLAAAAS
jgi:6,7-dimethyl-8-ribityllumazine synthase